MPQNGPFLAKLQENAQPPLWHLTPLQPAGLLTPTAAFQTADGSSLLLICHTHGWSPGRLAYTPHKTPQNGLAGRHATFSFEGQLLFCKLPPLALCFLLRSVLGTYHPESAKIRPKLQGCGPQFEAQSQIFVPPVPKCSMHPMKLPVVDRIQQVHVYDCPQHPHMPGLALR